MNLKVRTKIILITVAILFFAVGSTTWISSYDFAQEYSGVLKSRLFTMGQTLKSQLDKLLSLGIPLHELVGFEEQLQELVKKYNEISYAMVVDPEGKILFHTDPGQHQKFITCPISLEGIKSKKEIVQVCDEGGVEHYEVILPVLGDDGKHLASVRVGFPVNILTQKIKSLAFHSIAIALAFLGLAILLLVFSLSTWVTNPLMKLTAVIQEIRQKGTDFTKRVEIQSQDEIGQLASAFNQMIEDLQKTTVSKDYVDNILETMIDTLIMVDQEGKIKSVNKATCNLLGYQEKEIIGKPAGIIFKAEEIALQGVDLRKLITEGHLRDYETIYKTKAGKNIPILFSGSVMRDKDGNMICIVCTGRDITERKRVEIERERILQDLQRALSEVKQLSGLLPICASCKKIRDDRGYWNQIEIYIRDHSDAEFSHGICPDCLKKLYPDFTP